MTHEWGRQIDDRSLGGRGRDGKGITLFCVTVREVGASGGGRGRETPKAHAHAHLPLYLLHFVLWRWVGIRLSFRTPYRYVCLYKAGLEFAPVTSGS